MCGRAPGSGVVLDPWFGGAEAASGAVTGVLALAGVLALPRWGCWMELWAGACDPHAPWDWPVQGAGHGWWVRALWIVLQRAGLVLGTSCSFCSSPCAHGSGWAAGTPADVLPCSP